MHSTYIQDLLEFVLVFILKEHQYQVISRIKFGFKASHLKTLILVYCHVDDTGMWTATETRQLWSTRRRRVQLRWQRGVHLRRQRGVQLRRWRVQLWRWRVQLCKPVWKTKQQPAITRGTVQISFVQCRSVLYIAVRLYKINYKTQNYQLSFVS